MVRWLGEQGLQAQGFATEYGDEEGDKEGDKDGVKNADVPELKLELTPEAEPP